MNSKESYAVRDLLTLAEKKMCCLQLLKNHLNNLCDTMDTADNESILALLDQESACRKQIGELDQKSETIRKENRLSSAPVWFFDCEMGDEAALANQSPEYRDLYEKLQEQRNLLNEIATLNEAAKAKAQGIQHIITEKIRQVVQQKNIIASYESSGSYQRGYLFDYKEGEKL